MMLPALGLFALILDQCGLAVAIVVSLGIMHVSVQGNGSDTLHSSIAIVRNEATCHGIQYNAVRCKRCDARCRVVRSNVYVYNERMCRSVAYEIAANPRRLLCTCVYHAAWGMRENGSRGSTSGAGTQVGVHPVRGFLRDPAAL